MAIKQRRIEEARTRGFLVIEGNDTDTRGAWLEEAVKDKTPFVELMIVPGGFVVTWSTFPFPPDVYDRACHLTRREAGKSACLGTNFDRKNLAGSATYRTRTQAKQFAKAILALTRSDVEVLAGTPLEEVPVREGPLP